jgi:hypothetical protein
VLKLFCLMARDCEDLVLDLQNSRVPTNQHENIKMELEHDCHNGAEASYLAGRPHSDAKILALDNGPLQTGL